MALNSEDLLNRHDLGEFRPGVPRVELHETVMIAHGDSYAVINKADFDESKHKLYAPPKSKGKE